jgi:plastocyanin
MKLQHGGVIIAMALLAAAGCQTSPLTSENRELAKFTRTGAIHDIRIGDTITPAELTARPGDEVRWVNGRSASGQIVFTTSLRDRVSCQNRFTGRDSTKVDPNEYVSLCFSSPGTYKYIARMGSPVPGGEKNLPGIVVIRGEESLPLVDTQPIQLNP